MRLPNVDQATIDRAKLEGYLLSEVHPVGRFKARFFASLGFTAHNWRELETAPSENYPLPPDAALAITLDDIPELTEVVEEIEAPSLLDVARNSAAMSGAEP